MEEIINKVANSKLVTVNLEDYYFTGNRAQIDISQWLYEGFVLREKDFRTTLKENDWSVYENAFVALYCSTDAVIPSWAYILITTSPASLCKESSGWRFTSFRVNSICRKAATRRLGPT